jgi:hypothetical protein
MNTFFSIPGTDLMRKSVLSYCSLIVVLFALTLISWSCYNGGGSEYPNAAPVTRLANIPPNGYISQNPRLTLYWVGDDPDGYVIGFRYTWTFRLNVNAPFEKKPYSTILNIGIDKSGGEKFALLTDASPAQLPAVYKYFATLPPEGIAADSSNKLDAGEALIVEGSHVWASNPSTVRFPVHVNPNSGTFIFDSQDTVNLHTFEIAAIDNLGALDAHPATVTFSTPQVSSPRGQIIDGPAPTDTVLVRSDTTDTYKGVLFSFRGFDPNSRTIDYSWVVDKNIWSSVPGRTVPWSEFSQNAFAKVSANAFPPESIYAVKHTIYLRTRNEFGSIDTLGYYVINGDTTFAQANFSTLYPEFLKPGFHPRTLLINASFKYSMDTVGYIRPNPDTLDNYYRGIFHELGRDGQYDIVYATGGPAYFPGLGILGRYSTIFMYADVVRFLGGDAVVNVLDGASILTKYVDCGGKMVITAYNMPSLYNSDFMDHVPHCSPNFLRRPYAFVGATGEKGYPDVSLDYAKIDTAWHNGPPDFPNSPYPVLGLPFMFAGRPSGFGEILYKYVDNGAPGGDFSGRTVGVRYQGLTYQVVYFGFPLYYCQRPTVVQILSHAFQDIGY